MTKGFLLATWIKTCTKTGLSKLTIIWATPCVAPAGHGHVLEDPILASTDSPTPRYTAELEEDALHDHVDSLAKTSLTNYDIFIMFILSAATRGR
jgi:hypothetical protein